ncbi:MAG: SRPBCC domain-containing protein [Planctomycetaceae bacterium]|nr:SRPBCC domain-containing protein [Planctomycetaceae bacterium]
MSSREASNEIRLTRVYDAPVAAVWDAWTDPEQVAQWWGPRGFTLTTHSKELKVGGIWHYTMHGPDGVDYPNKTLYHEVEPLRKLVYDHGGNDERAPLFRVTVTFTSQGDQTVMEFCMQLETPEQAAETRKFIKAAGGNATWDRLAEYLDDQANGQGCFVINRSFDAPQEVVFDAWADPAQLSQWLPPAGFQVKYIECDIRIGGQSFYCMSNGQGVTLYGRARYLELDRPVRLAYTQQFCDEHGNLGRHPGLPVFPSTLLNTIVIARDSDGGTRVTLTSRPYGEATPEERQVFRDIRGGMTQGWTGSFDALEALLRREVSPGA